MLQLVYIMSWAIDSQDRGQVTIPTLTTASTHSLPRKFPALVNSFEKHVKTNKIWPSWAIHKLSADQCCCEI